MKEKPRSFMLARFKELSKDRKILQIIKEEGGVTIVQFENKVTLRLSHSESDVLKKDLKEFDK